MAKVAVFYGGDEHILPTTDTCNDLKTEVKKRNYKNMTIRYTSVGQDVGNQTINGVIPEYRSSLPAELDIFCRLPQLVYEFREVKDFLNDLRTVIIHGYLQSELENIILSKLTVSEYSDTGVVIDWVFNYFQMYFTFDKNDGNYWGTVMADNEEGEFCNSVIKIRPENSADQAQAVLATAVMLLR